MVTKLEQEIISDFKNKNPGEDPSKAFALTDEEFKHSFDQCKVLLKKGRLEENIYQALVKLFVHLMKKSQEKMSDRQKRSIDVYTFEVLKLLYLYTTYSDEE
jgi:hypothetical protein